MSSLHDCVEHHRWRKRCVHSTANPLQRCLKSARVKFGQFTCGHMRHTNTNNSTNGNLLLIQRGTVCNVIPHLVGWYVSFSSKKTRQARANGHVTAIRLALMTCHWQPLAIITYSRCFSCYYFASEINHRTGIMCASLSHRAGVPTIMLLRKFSRWQSLTPKKSVGLHFLIQQLL